VHRVAGRLEFSVLSGVQFTLLRNQQSTKWSPLCESRSVNVLGEVVGFMRGAAGMECRDGCTLLFGEARPCCHAPRHRSAFSLAATEDALNISRKSRTEGPPLSGVGCRASVVGRRPRLAPNRLELNLLGPTLDVSNCLESTRAESARADAGCVQLPRRFQHILLLSHPRRPQVVYRYSTACSESPTRRNPSSFPTHARPFEACEFSQIHPAISGTKRPRQVPRGI